MSLQPIERSRAIAFDLFSMVARWRGVFYMKEKYILYLNGFFFNININPIFVKMIQQMGVNAMQQLNGLSISRHGSQVQRIASVVITMK